MVAFVGFGQCQPASQSLNARQHSQLCTSHSGRCGCTGWWWQLQRCVIWNAGPSGKTATAGVLWGSCRAWGGASCTATSTGGRRAAFTGSCCPALLSVLGAAPCSRNGDHACELAGRGRGRERGHDAAGCGAPMQDTSNDLQLFAILSASLVVFGGVLKVRRGTGRPAVHQC